jgi:FMN-binding domain
MSTGQLGPATRPGRARPITVKGGKITAASVPVYPNGTMHDQQLNSYAIPQLIQETVAADSANISAVSGATYTSQGYDLRMSRGVAPFVLPDVARRATGHLP